MSSRGSAPKLPLRKLRPAPALRPRPAMVAKATKKARAKNACLTCQQTKKKCNEERPRCSSCIETNVECGYNTKNSVRHKRMTMRSQVKTYESDIENYERIFKHIMTSSIPALHRVMGVIRGEAPLEEIISFIRNDENPHFPPAVVPPEQAVPDVGLHVKAQYDNLPSQYDALNVDLIDHRLPLSIMATPWTALTGDNELVSHLMSLYRFWDSPVWYLYDSDVALNTMTNLDQSYYSSSLFNTTLADASVNQHTPYVPQSHGYM
ncbi:hypothetical protein ABW21_db0204130 [Orbilia brochopaga]|nr:hypothetical protein ABW21_db0204130 [Drechslerella brochopaga]